MIGKVLWWSERDGIGVIVDNAGNEFYADISVTPKRVNLKRNQKVQFKVNPAIKDCNCAYKIEVLND